MASLLYKEFYDFVTEYPFKYQEIRDKALALLENKPESLGLDVYDVYEQLVISGIFLGDEKLTKMYLELLQNTFGESDRVNVLFGMVLERMGRYEDAMYVYKQIVDNTPHPLAMKRMITLTKTIKGEQEAIPELISYLKIYMNDKNAWMELTDIYLNNKLYSKAKFCVEELILMCPNNFAYLEKYAEIVIAADDDDLESFLMARKYLCFSLCIDNNMSSSLILLKKICEKISQFSLPSSVAKENSEILERATNRLEKLLKCK